MTAFILTLAMFFGCIGYVAQLFFDYLSKDEKRDSEINRLNEELTQIKKSKNEKV